MVAPTTVGFHDAPNGHDVHAVCPVEGPNVPRGQGKHATLLPELGEYVPAGQGSTLPLPTVDRVYENTALTGWVWPPVVLAPAVMHNCTRSPTIEDVNVYVSDHDDR